MFDGQLEMSFGQAVQISARRQRRQTRAHLWFQRMRQIVDRATDWQPCPPPRPEQIWFPVAQSRAESANGAQRDANRGPSDEREICE